ncbi:MAG TPA: hypothetical protein VLN59_04125 [Burkholderiales bacterium]|nr:hypothetical protein [Burkholderiales bacterium]
MEQIKQFIAWIGGAVAGLSILFYAAGYLVYRAHINMLGLAGVIDYPHEQLLYEGAKFYFTVGAYLLKNFFVVGIAVLIALILVMLLRQIGWVDRGVRFVADWLHARRDRWNARHPALLRACLLAVLGALFVIHTDRFFYPLQDLYTGIEQLLYRPPPPRMPANCAVPGGANADIVTAVTLWLQQGETCRYELLSEFRRILAGYLVLLAAAYFALHKERTDSSTVSRIGIGTLAVYGVLYTLLLPVAFGVLVRSPIYPVITLKSKAAAGDASPTLQLLDRNDRSLLVWDARARIAAWLRADSAVEIDVRGQANLFSPPPPAGGAAP